MVHRRRSQGLKPHGGVIAWLKEVEEAKIFVSAMTIGELQVGVEITRRQDADKAAGIAAWVDEDC